jgi:hypothetical protein
LWLENDETIIIEIAAENPPRKTITVNTLLSKTVESIRNRYLNYGLSFKRILPLNYWKNKRLKSSRYNGKSQMAVRMWVSLLFSTIAVWNCLGKENKTWIEYKEPVDSVCNAIIFFSKSLDSRF